MQVSQSGAPGDPAGWFLGNNFDCASHCGQTTNFGGEAGWTYGVRDSARTPYALGVVVSGPAAFLDGYMQLGTSPQLPYGVGARLGAQLGGNPQAQLYGRMDFPVGETSRILWNPALLYAASSSASSSASWVGISNGVGVELRSAGVSFTPSIAWVVGNGVHDNGSFREGPTTKGFLSAAVNLTLGASR